MTTLTIRHFPDSCLRKKASQVKKIGENEKKILAEMAEMMYLTGGVGLAAVQVGIDKQLAVVDAGSGLIKLINPIITKREGCDAQEEGCLSVPDTIVKVKRAKTVVVAFITEEGELVQLNAEGLLARVIQHEIDHLLGRLIVDYLNPVKKLLLRKPHKKSRKKST